MQLRAMVALRDGWFMGGQWVVNGRLMVGEWFVNGCLMVDLWSMMVH